MDEGAYSEEYASRILKQVAIAIYHLHSRGIVHRARGPTPTPQRLPRRHQPPNHPTAMPPTAPPSTRPPIRYTPLHAVTSVTSVTRPGDIKPENVVFETEAKGDTHVKLIDFGTAVALEERGTRLTRRQPMPAATKQPCALTPARHACCHPWPRASPSATHI